MGEVPASSCGTPFAWSGLEMTSTSCRKTEGDRGGGEDGCSRGEG